MRITTTFRTGYLILLCITLTITVILFSLSLNINHNINEQKYTSNIIKGIFELNIVTNDYLLHHEKRAEIQWKLKYDSLKKLINKEKIVGTKKEQLINKIQSEFITLPAIIGYLTEVRHKYLKNERKTKLYADIEQRKVSILLQKSQNIISNAFLLSKYNFTELEKSQAIMSFLFILFGAIILFSILFASHIMRKKIILPIIYLREDVKIIGNGNLNHQIRVVSEDEIGQLANSFDQMTKKLKDKITEITEANAKLEKYQKHLESLVEERTIKLKESNMKLQDTLKKLKQSTQMMIQSEKMATLGTFAAGTAHELNNPLMGILNYIQYCLKHTTKDDRKYSVLVDAENETNRCSKIVKGILTFSFPDYDGSESFKHEKISTIVNNVLQLVAYRVRKEKLNINVEIPGDGFTLFMKPNKFQQVILNLVTNAMDALNEAKMKEIKITATREKNRAIISVIDNGPGIEEKDIGKVFEPFFSTKGAGKGIGLGLSTVKQIVDELEGDISCKSIRGVGTTFKIVLPLK